MSEIDWKRVDERLRCPQCGDKAHISSGTDGTEAEHTHRFQLTRAEALRLSRPSAEEVKRRIQELEAELAHLRQIETE